MTIANARFLNSFATERDFDYIGQLQNITGIRVVSPRGQVIPVPVTRGRPGQPPGKARDPAVGGLTSLLCRIKLYEVPVEPFGTL